MMTSKKSAAVSRVSWAPWVLVALTTSGCNACSGNGGRDADLDAEADQRDGGDADADTDRDRDAEPDLLSGLCDDAGPAWTWHPYECGDEPDPPDCCQSCRRLTCRQPSARANGMWGDKVAVRAGGDVSIVDLSTGEDVLAFAGTDLIGYGPAAVSSRYIVARKLDHSDPDFFYSSAGSRPALRGTSSRSQP